MKPRILLLGGTGSMGSYLVPELLSHGWAVDVFAMDRRISNHPDLRFMVGNAKDIPTLKSLLSAKYDAVIDFLDYPADYCDRYRLFCENTRHYIFLSSYRVYTDLDPLTHEDSPRHIDTASDEAFRNSNDYAIYKARNENLLFASEYDNWTIVRPSIVFSRLSLPLVAFGAWSIVNRARTGKPTVIPESAVSKYGTATWSGDIAKMFAGILLKPDTYRQAYTLATHDCMHWDRFAEVYHDVIGLSTYVVDDDTYRRIYCGGQQWAEWQLDYDRLLNRAMDNRKILRAAGLTESDLMPTARALEYELCELPRELTFVERSDVNVRLDAFFTYGGKTLRKLY